MSDRLAPAILRAKLLEFLKFRVLAAQAEFFSALITEPEADPLRSPLDLGRLRQYLAKAAPIALSLSDADLIAVFEQARQLYIN